MAKLEAPEEIVKNNAIIATQDITNLQWALMEGITEDLPLICSMLVVLENNNELSYEHCLAANISTVNCTEPTSARLIESLLQRVYVTRLKSCPSTNYTKTNYTKPNMTEEVGKNPILDTINLDNLTELSTNLPTWASEATIEGGDLISYMTKCGAETMAIAGSYKFSDIIQSELISSQVSFNWIQCQPPENKKKGVSGAFNEGVSQFFNSARLHPSKQDDTVYNAWKEDQQALYCEYVQENLKQNQTLLNARLDALTRSFQDADGFNGEG